MATTEAGRLELMGSGAGASLIAVAGGIALVVLGILSLAKVESSLLNSIAVIVAGVIALIASASLSAQYAHALTAHEGHGLNPNEVGGGMSAGVIAGGAGIVLGILAILSIASDQLTAIAVIVFGGALLLEFIARAQIKALRIMGDEQPGQTARMAMAVSSSTNTAAVLVAVALIALGIIALTGLVGIVLVAVAFLVLGTYLFLDGTAAARWLFDIISY